MRKLRLFSRLTDKAALLVVMSLLVGVLAGADASSAQAPFTADDFELAAPQGFGDRQNSWAWSMQWWNGYLYVGTNRAFHCAEIAAFYQLLPNWFPYPPEDPDLECATPPEDLPLQAEIWRWSAATDVWERVFQSPEDVPLPGHPGTFVARDLGLRGMVVFQESDGTEALYVGTVSPSFIWPDTQTASILRSEDGINFERVPADPGTTLGDFPFSSMRNQIVHDGRFFINGGQVQGSGVVLEAAEPAGGNDNFSLVSLPGQVVSSMASYDGELYLGLRDFRNGYSIVKTDAQGPLPYTYTTILPEGAYLPGQTNIETLNMKTFNDRLYVGTNGNRLFYLGQIGPAEVIRINPDDTWDIVAGNPRWTPDGWKFPISGFDAGFANFFNLHMWRMEDYGGNLYLGTFDASTILKDTPEAEPLVRDMMGFDFFRTPNGMDFYPITLNGFGDRFDTGVRSMAATPRGLFVGTANYYYGLKILRAFSNTFNVFLPQVAATGNTRQQGPVLPESAVLSPVAAANAPEPPSFVQGESLDSSAVVSWEPVEGIDEYRIMRSPIVSMTVPLNPALGLTVNATKWITPTEVGIASGTTFEDTTARGDRRYVYFVYSINDAGQDSATSMAAPTPSLALEPTLDHLNGILVEAQTRGYLTAAGEIALFDGYADVRALVLAGNYTGAADELADLRTQMDTPGQLLIVDWKAVDVSHFMHQLELRVRLVEAGFLDPSDVM